MRFENVLRPVYPLTYYRDEIKRPNLTTVLAQATLAIRPKPFRLFWDNIPRKGLLFTGVGFLYLIGVLIALERSLRSEPLEVARRFFAAAGFTRMQPLTHRVLGLAQTLQAPTAFAALWLDDWKILTPDLQRHLPASATERLKLYALYDDAPPSSDAIQAFRAQFAAEVIPLASRTLERALSENTSSQRLRELEEPFLTRADPYNESRPINDPTWFYGRHELLQRLPAVLYQGQHAGLFGLRKVGKTSVINQLRTHMQSVPVMWLDCQGYEPVANDLLQAILQQLHAELRRFELRKLPGIEPLATTDFRSQFLRLHDAWSRSGRQGRFILILDEVDKLFPDRRLPASEKTLGEYVRLFRLLRALAQDRQCLSVLVVAYRPDVNRLDHLTDSAGENPMFMSYQEHYLGFLDAQETEAMVKEIGLWKDIRWAPGALAQVYQLCGGHPLLTRFLASDACAEGDRKQVDESHVGETAGAIRSHFRRHRVGTYYKESVWMKLDAAEQRVLQLVSEAGGELPESSLPDDLKDAAIHVERFGLIERRDNHLRIGATLFRQWLAQEEYA